MPESINKLEKSLAQKDFKEIYTISHRLKPSFELLGIRNLKNNATDIEEYISKDTQHDEVIRLAKEIINVTKKAIEELKHYAT